LVFIAVSETVARGELRLLRNPAVTRNSLHDAARVDDDGSTGLFPWVCLLAQEFKRIGCRLCLCMKGFPERWIIKLPRCLPVEKFPTFASHRQGREQQRFQISVVSFT
jgi:hypothetical protein